MTTEHDFQNTIHDFQFSFTKEEYGHHYGTILFSLRLSHKLLKQEPSEGMVLSGNASYEPDYDKYVSVDDIRNIFKSMLTTAVKEIENEQ